MNDLIEYSEKMTTIYSFLLVTAIIYAVILNNQRHFKHTTQEIGINFDR